MQLSITIKRRARKLPRYVLFASDWVGICYHVSTPVALLWVIGLNDILSCMISEQNIC